jgi:TonB family protein
MTTLAVWNIQIVWNIQVALLVSAGVLAAAALSTGRARLIFWQCLLVTLLLLPVIEPWKSGPMVVLQNSAGQAISLPVSVCGPDTSHATTIGCPTGIAQTAPWKKPETWMLLLAAGAALRLIWIAAGFLRLRRFRKAARLLAEPPLPFASTSARWYVSASVPGPVAYGWRSPSILLPERVMQLPSALREAIACHELVHVRRGDWLFVLGEEVIRAALWFHPAVWFVLGRIQLAREHAVDSEVVRLTNDRDGYLDALVEVAALGLRPELAPAPLFLRKRHLSLRVAEVLKEAPMSKSRMAARVAAACSSMAVTAGLALWLIPFVSAAQTVQDDPGVTVDAGATLMHRAAVRNPARAAGVLTLEASLNAKGEVTDAHVMSGPEDLRKDALTSVLQWHYTPGPTRVQISMRFDATEPAGGIGAGVGGGLGGGLGGGVGAGVARGVPRDVPAGVPGGRSGTFTSAPRAAAVPTTLKSIDVAGFSPEAEQEIRRRIPLRIGDPIAPQDIARTVDGVHEYDSHALLSWGEDAATHQTALRITSTTSPPVFSAAPKAVVSFPGAHPIGSVIAAANIVNQPQPVYPQLAKQARIQGVVKFEIKIGKDGSVQQMELISGSPLLVQAAKDAVSQWTYRPTRLNNEPVEVQTEVTVNFSLTD